MISAQAKNYGKAFLATQYQNNFARVPIEGYQRWLDFLQQHRELPVCLSMSSVSVVVKKELISNIIKHCGLGASEEVLMEMLYRRRDALLLSEIVRYICDAALAARNEEAWEITSAQQLTLKEQQTLIDAVAHATAKKILPTFVVDTALLAGIKMRSRTQYWERTLAQLLRKIDHFVINQE